MITCIPIWHICFKQHSPLQRIHPLVNALDGVCDAFELLSLVDGLGVGAAHDPEHVTQREVHRAVLLLGAVVELTEEAHDAPGLLLGGLQSLLLRLHLLLGDGER